jgi:RNA polymerase sigma-70 factor (ECF subfamily)
MIRLPSSGNGDDEDQQSDSLNDSEAETPPPPSEPSLDRRLAEFERLYRAQFGPVAGYFARRTRDPQLVADLTADTFVAAMRAYASFDPGRTGALGWTLGIARRVYAHHLESAALRDGRPRVSARQLLSPEETEEMLWRIDVEHSGAEAMQRLGSLADVDREAIELVDLVGLAPGEVAHELGVSTRTLHVRLLLARARLRRQGVEDV